MVSKSRSAECTPLPELFKIKRSNATTIKNQFHLSIKNNTRPLKNVFFYPISFSDPDFNPPSNFGGLILEIFNVFLPISEVRQIVLTWLKSSTFLNLTKIEHFSKDSVLYSSERLQTLFYDYLHSIFKKSI